MIEIRFYCNDIPLYWHELSGDDHSSGTLSEQRCLRGKKGVLTFHADKDYPAFYMFDDSEAGCFFLLAIAPHSKNAFKIHRVRVCETRLRQFLADYHPKHRADIQYNIMNS